MAGLIEIVLYQVCRLAAAVYENNKEADTGNNQHIL